MTKEELINAIMEQLQHCIKGFQEAESPYIELPSIKCKGKFITFTPNASATTGDIVEVRLATDMILGFVLSSDVIRTDIYYLGDDVAKWAKEYVDLLAYSKNILWEK